MTKWGGRGRLVREVMGWWYPHLSVHASLPDQHSHVLGVLKDGTHGRGMQRGFAHLLGRLVFPLTIEHRRTFVYKKPTTTPIWGKVREIWVQATWLISI